MLFRSQVDSLKVYAMLKLLESKGKWWTDEIVQHESEMLEVLLDAANKQS